MLHGNALILRTTSDLKHSGNLPLTDRQIPASPQGSCGHAHEIRLFDPASPPPGYREQNIREREDNTCSHLVSVTAHFSCLSIASNVDNVPQTVAVRPALECWSCSGPLSAKLSDHTVEQTLAESRLQQNF